MPTKTLKRKAISVDKPKTKKIKGKIANANVANGNKPKAKPQKKVLFIMFQGSGTNLKNWNPKESRFLDRLKKLGSVYTYQDKIYNIHHYDKSNPDHKDFDSDINIDLEYVMPDTHIKMVYDDIQAKYKNIEEYKFIPIVWSMGGGMALYFCQKYKQQCIHCILLDPLYITPTNILSTLKSTLKNISVDNTNITNNKLQKMLYNLKKYNTEENLKIVENTIDFIRFSFYLKNLNLKLPVKTTSFINIENPAEYKWQKDNNKNRLNEIKILKKNNPENYTSIIFENKTHMIYDKIQPAKKNY